MSTKPTLTKDMINDAAERFRARTGNRPSAASGDATQESIDQALRNGARGLPGGDSLKKPTE